MQKPLLSIGAGLTGVVTVTWALAGLSGVPNPTIAALAYVLVVGVVAARAPLQAALVTSVGAFLAFNFFFLPPIGTFTIADPQNWVALGTLLIVSLTVSRLSAEAQAQAADARAQRDDAARLFDLSRDVLQVTGDRGSLPALARSLMLRYHFDGALIAVRTAAGWERHVSGLPCEVPDSELDQVCDAAEHQVEFDARARAYRGQVERVASGRRVRLVPVRSSSGIIGILAVGGGPDGPGSLDAVAGLVAIALDRVEQFEVRRAAELTQASDSLKSTLLASLAHDLRTPLTAIRAAAHNVEHAEATGISRQEQLSVIQEEVDRLDRLFANILDMARLDAGGVVSVPIWVPSSEVIEAARRLAGPALTHHHLVVDAGDDHPIHLDAKLIAAALAHLLQNSARYAPAGTRITITSSRNESAIVFTVEDQGPGIRADEAERIFAPFVRGTSSQSRMGTGLGLAIARGLVTAAGGRIWVDPKSRQGARFSIAVDAPSREPLAAGEDDPA